jgi:hypothetical protein
MSQPVFLLVAEDRAVLDELAAPWPPRLEAKVSSGPAGVGRLTARPGTLLPRHAVDRAGHRGGRCHTENRGHTDRSDNDAACRTPGDHSGSFRGEASRADEPVPEWIAGQLRARQVRGFWYLLVGHWLSRHHVWR